MTMRRLAPLIAVVFATSLLVSSAACSTDETIPDDPARDLEEGERAVVLYQYQFNPNTIEIQPGTTIVFQNRDPESHNVNIPALSIDEEIDPNDEWAHTFETRGEFAVDNRHIDGMRLDLAVEDDDHDDSD